MQAFKKFVILLIIDQSIDQSSVQSLRTNYVHGTQQEQKPDVEFNEMGVSTQMIEEQESF